MLVFEIEGGCSSYLDLELLMLFAWYPPLEAPTEKKPGTTELIVKKRGTITEKENAGVLNPQSAENPIPSASRSPEY